MPEALTGPVSLGTVVALVLLAYGFSFRQLRRRLPERWLTYAFTFIATGAGATVAGLLRDIEPLLLACMPLGLFGIGLLAVRREPVARGARRPAPDRRGSGRTRLRPG